MSQRTTITECSPESSSTEYTTQESTDMATSRQFERRQYKRVNLDDRPYDHDEELEYNKLYYSNEHIPSLGIRRYNSNVILLGLLVLSIFFLCIMLRPATENKKMDASTQTDRIAAFEEPQHTKKKSLGAALHCDPEMLKPSETVPDDVNKIRPADIKLLAAMGDSLTISSLSTNFDDDPLNVYPGNSWATGGDEDLETHISIANILKKFNPSLKGFSKGRGYTQAGFNVAVGGMTCYDLPRQAFDLVNRIRLQEENLVNEWKLITLFIGTNDIGNLSCYKEMPYIPRDEYKFQIEKALGILKENLPRAIVAIVPMWQPQFDVEASVIITTGDRKTCAGGDRKVIGERDRLCGEYKKVAYEIQNEKKFDTKEFTVVCQGFVDDIDHPFTNNKGEYDFSFYAVDKFHLSKYGNAAVARSLWNCLLEPVGSKNTKAPVGDDATPLKCPQTTSPYIRTLGNSVS